MSSKTPVKSIQLTAVRLVSSVSVRKRSYFDAAIDMGADVPRVLERASSAAKQIEYI